jgi:hypothetical protein
MSDITGVFVVQSGQDFDSLKLIRIFACYKKALEFAEQIGDGKGIVHVEYRDIH